MTHFPLKSVNDASTNLLGRETQRATADAQLVLMQKHTIKNIPINECQILYAGGRMGVFFVYGQDCQVYVSPRPALPTMDGWTFGDGGMGLPYSAECAVLLPPQAPDYPSKCCGCLCVVS